MTWKTDWSPVDNYAAEGAAHFARLLDNYHLLRARLAELHYTVTLEDIQTLGYATLPFADMLNTVERNLAALHVLTIRWIPWSGEWQPGAALPSFEDINRWEQNGKYIDNAITAIGQIQVPSGTYHSGAAYYFISR